MSDSQNSKVYKTIDHLYRHETGKMVSVSGSTSIDAFTLINDNHILQGVGLASYFGKPDLMQETYQYLFSQAATGKLKVHIGQTFPLKDAAEAHRQMENRKTSGKIVLIPLQLKNKATHINFNNHGKLSKLV